MYGSLVLRPKTSTRGSKWPRVEALDGKLVRGIFDYSNCSRAGNGIAIYYALPPGVYFVREILSWKRNKNYYISVDENGEITELPKENVRDQRLGGCASTHFLGV